MTEKVKDRAQQSRPGGTLHKKNAVFAFSETLSLKGEGWERALIFRVFSFYGK